MFKKNLIIYVNNRDTVVDLGTENFATNVTFLCFWITNINLYTSLSMLRIFVKIEYCSQSILLRHFNTNDPNAYIVLLAFSIPHIDHYTSLSKLRLFDNVPIMLFAIGMSSLLDTEGPDVDVPDVDDPDADDLLLNFLITVGACSITSECGVTCW